jgi:hypothetical protein
MLLLVISGCASKPLPPATTSNAAAVAQPSPWIDAAQAVPLAATVAPKSVAGTFAMQVQGTGREGSLLYLNSETDYRDQRNLTAVILPEAAARLTDLLGSTADVVLKDKRILVTGAAQRVKVHFTANGMRTEKYYYQTHLLVSDANQIQIPTQADTQRFDCLRQFEIAKTTLLGNKAPYAVIFSGERANGDGCIIHSLYAAPADKDIYVMGKWVGKPSTLGKQTYADSRNCPRLLSVLREVEKIPTPALPGPGSQRPELLPSVAKNYRFWTHSAKFDNLRHEIEFSGDSIAPWLAGTRVLDACWSELEPTF